MRRMGRLGDENSLERMYYCALLKEKETFRSIEKDCMSDLNRLRLSPTPRIEALYPEAEE